MTNLMLSILIPLLLITDKIKYSRSNTYEINDYKSFMKNNESSSDNKYRENEIYLQAIKETSDLYYLDNEKYRTGKICKSNLVYEDVRDRMNFYAKLKENFLNNCTYVIGNLIIAHISHEDISFLDSIEEISGYLFLFSNSIETISLNKLKIIRGENPWSFEGEKFSFIIGNNYVDGNLLKYLLLPELQVILKGNVLVYHNPGLCYVKEKIRWYSIISKSQNSTIIEHKNSTCFQENKSGTLNCHKSCKWYLGKQFCWSNSRSNCQRINECTWRKCSNKSKCYIHSLPNREECCHVECTGGCYGSNRKQCLACKNFNNNGVCVKNCSEIRKNITNNDGKFAFHQYCVDRCPVDFLIENGKCVAKCSLTNPIIINQTCQACPNDGCPKKCYAKDVLENWPISYLNRKMVNRLENCTIYDGNIVINTLSIEGDPLNGYFKDQYGIRSEDLMKLNNLKEIYGYLKINVGATASWLKSLIYFKNLKLIRAETVDLLNSEGLSIINNRQLVLLGLQSLREVRRGNVIIENNTNLCYTKSLVNESIEHNGFVRISGNGELGNCDNRNCSKTCHPKYGCWGPFGFFCVKCRNFQIPDKRMCVSNCSKISGYYFDENNIGKYKNHCSKCHSECVSNNGSCYGPNANQCTFGCVNYMYKDNCVTKCPPRHYNDQSTTRSCHPCHILCTTSDLFSNQPVCKGPEAFLETNGCLMCNHVRLVTEVSSTNKITYGLQCVDVTNNCQSGYFKFIVNFNSSETSSKLYSLYSNNSIITNIIKKWIDKETNHDLEMGSICLPCHPYCSQCSDNALKSCEKCKYYKSGSQCVDECGKDHFIRNVTNGNIGEQQCLKCHDECFESCEGPTEYECKQCKTVKIYVNSSRNEYFCNASCGNYVPIYANSEMLCVEPFSIGKLTLKHYVAGLFGFVTVVLSFAIISKCILSSLKNKKPLQMKVKFLNDLHSPECQNLSIVLRNNSSKLIISGKQLVCNDIIGSGMFGVVHKGFWQPNQNEINENKLCVFKLLDKNPMKVNVAVKSFTQISNSANDGEIREKIQILAAINHSCCLRILCLCLTTHLQLITQFMPLGNLLGFLRENRMLISNNNLLVWCKQIACGMAYLESKDIIHCDLAARNVLIESPDQIKITDFGFIQLLDYAQLQTCVKDGRMPIKWLAIESIKHLFFSSKSDVWSYGVTLWEIFTFGEIPYRDIEDYEVLKHLENDQRLNKPVICETDVYNILFQCWKEDPQARPTFSDLKSIFEEMIANPDRYLKIKNGNFNEQLVKNWNCDARQYEQFLQELLTLSQNTSENDKQKFDKSTKNVMKSLENRYVKLQKSKNKFIINEICSDTEEKLKRSLDINKQILLEHEDKFDQPKQSSSRHYEDQDKYLPNDDSIKLDCLNTNKMIDKNGSNNNTHENETLVMNQNVHSESFSTSPDEQF